MLLTAFFPRSECPQDEWKAAVHLCAAQSPPRLPHCAHLKFVQTILAKASVPQATCLLHKASPWASLLRGILPCTGTAGTGGEPARRAASGFCHGNGEKKRRLFTTICRWVEPHMGQGWARGGCHESGSSLALRGKRGYAVTEHPPCACHFAVEVTRRNLHVDQQMFLQSCSSAVLRWIRLGVLGFFFPLSQNSRI